MFSIQSRSHDNLRKRDDNNYQEILKKMENISKQNEVNKHNLGFD